jgi:hypothetical protein
MDQRDRAFLHDIRDFICLNRLVTVLALYQTTVEPDSTTQLAMKMLDASLSEEDLSKFTTNNAGNVQGIMIARIYAELFAGYEDLGALGQAIQNRNDGGIFRRYVNNQTWQSTRFLQSIIDGNIPEHPDITLDVLLRLPPVAKLEGHVPQEQFNRLHDYYQSVPRFLYGAAMHYQSRRGDAKAISAEAAPQLDLGGVLAIILGDESPRPGSSDDRLSRTVFNRIKHQFLVTGNLSAYLNTTNSRPLEFVFLSREQDFTNQVLELIVSTARVLSDIASILLLLDGLDIDL